ncbi:hypothetical protein KPC83_06200 [Collinsella sp. zg1085]|uniref:AfsR/SARP family transcriptional regulator n=1 Tax=Collinsella sp. zg1085 TaxID=2844380 RepID=UPI001C0C6CD7|nr:BTAD domain-containing putative transcriptional regulator [Collinsella sp. zg1085]QWT17427.1 hypothetical protein KPC83_06200 [Collinsella sp. zg1085]
MSGQSGTKKRAQKHVTKRERVQPLAQLTVPELAGSMVLRERLVRTLLAEAKTAGIAFICAPKGFGKTSLLLQCSALIQNEPGQGMVSLVSGNKFCIQDLVKRIREIRTQIPESIHSFMFIDDLPPLDLCEVKAFARVLRALRKQNCTSVITCTPAHRHMVNAVGDSYKLRAHMVRVQPAEYRDWAKAYTISKTLDMYGMTQGIPSLVAAMGSVSSSAPDGDYLDEQIIALYQSILDETAHDEQGMGRIIRLMMLVDSSHFQDLDLVGLKIKHTELSRLQHEYPIFLFDMAERRFACLKGRGTKLSTLRRTIARKHPDLLAKAVRIQMKTGRVDTALELVEALFSHEQKLELIAQFPTACTLAGRPSFVLKILSQIQVAEVHQVDIGVLAALYGASLVMGELKTARTASHLLHKRASEIEQNISIHDWNILRGLYEVHATCIGVGLPELSDAYLRQAEEIPSRCLKQEAQRFRCLIQELEQPIKRRRSLLEDLLQGEVLESKHIAQALCDNFNYIQMLELVNRELEAIWFPLQKRRLLHENELKLLIAHLEKHKLIPMAAKLRFVASLSRLLQGLPVVDERAFCDLNIISVREADHATQLTAMLCEGWQALSLGQHVTGQFRGQQVLKHGEGSYVRVEAWAKLLEQCSHLIGGSRVKVREEAGLFDVASEVETGIDAWVSAMQLSAARYDTDLSIWYSRHKQLMLNENYVALLRLPLALMGDWSSSIRQLLPLSTGPLYELNPEFASQDMKHVSSGKTALVSMHEAEIGQLVIALFGGLRVERNGHIIVHSSMRRKRSSDLIARLALSLGTFVSRDVLLEQLWPDSPRLRARQALYSATSALKHALGQTGTGPDYIVGQGDGIGLNAEYVFSDVLRFDLLAKDILLAKPHGSSQDIVEACLLLEEIYAGKLYCPTTHDAYFKRMRRAYESKYLDCLVRGIDAAMEDDDMASASWLVDAALKQSPTREDCLRRIMTVLLAVGRRREVYDVYAAHVGFLQKEMKGEPEPETKQLFEQIMSDQLQAACI